MVWALVRYWHRRLLNRQSWIQEEVQREKQRVAASGL